MKHPNSSRGSAASGQALSPARAAYLKALCQAAGEPFDPNISAAEATRRIAELQEKTGRKPSTILSDGQTDG